MKIPLRHFIAAQPRRGPLAGAWYRAILPVYFSTAPSTGHSRTVPGRFNDASPSVPAYPYFTCPKTPS